MSFTFHCVGTKFFFCFNLFISFFFYYFYYLVIMVTGSGVAILGLITVDGFVTWTKLDDIE